MQYVNTHMLIMYPSKNALCVIVLQYVDVLGQDIKYRD